MQDKELWKTFEKTGSVVDYLSYRGVCSEEVKAQCSEAESDISVGNEDAFEGNKF